MIARSIQFLGLLALGFALEQRYGSETLAMSANVRRFDQFLALQAVGTLTLIGIIILWAASTKKKRERKEYMTLLARKSILFGVPATFVVIKLLRNIQLAEDLPELIEMTAYEMLFTAIFAFPVIAFYFCFYPILGGLKRTEQGAAGNCGQTPPL